MMTYTKSVALVIVFCAGMNSCASAAGQDAESLASSLATMPVWQVR
ncbi:MAG: hypothetical protein JO142_21605 [Burkholderiales bacterium]|nr:hypothetical protein [Burkholderiales bacterium]